MISFRMTLGEHEGDAMQKPGQTTSFQVRFEIMEQASAGLNDTQIATGWRLARCGRYANGDEERSSVVVLA